MHRDHPRLRGEHFCPLSCMYITRGSPPLTRGTLDEDAFKLMSPGITPAYAGNTSCNMDTLQLFQDHPRLRGEHRYLSYRDSIPQGSPPLTRGTLYATSTVTDASRITPAYAGNTRITDCSIFLTEDHPRLRGEHSKKIP